MTNAVWGRMQQYPIPLLREVYRHVNVSVALLTLRLSSRSSTVAKGRRVLVFSQEVDGWGSILGAMLVTVIGGCLFWGMST